MAPKFSSLYSPATPPAPRPNPKNWPSFKCTFFFICYIWLKFNQKNKTKKKSHKKPQQKLINHWREFFEPTATHTGRNGAAIEFEKKETLVTIDNKKKIS